MSGGEATEGSEASCLGIAMLKAPVAGKVKTRLARDVGEATALSVYRGLAKWQVQQMPARWEREIRFSPDDAGEAMREWLGDGYLYRRQGYGDLGRRMERGTLAGFRRGYDKVIVVGADCPSLDGKALEEAARALDDCRCVVGPTSDGGYYLIGLRPPLLPALFRGMSWSTREVFRETARRLDEAEIAWRALEQRDDIDDGADLSRNRGLVQERLAAVGEKPL